MNTAIVLAGGKGSRMNSEIPKQYIELGGRPLLFYTLDTFDKCDVIDEIIIVAAEEYVAYCRTEIAQKYQLNKVRGIVAGGKERYDSVYQGLRMVRDDKGMVLIHDGARACVTEDVIERCVRETEIHRACAAGVPVKDTIKVVDDLEYAVRTPDRKMLWQVQTPQAFQTTLIKEAYERMQGDTNQGVITDDAMVVENYSDCRVKMVMGDYHNIKVTTPEDLEIAGLFLHV